MNLTGPTNMLNASGMVDLNSQNNLRQVSKNRLLIGETLNNTANITRDEAGNLTSQGMQSSQSRFKNRSMSKPSNGLPPSNSSQNKLTG